MLITVGEDVQSLRGMAKAKESPLDLIKVVHLSDTEESGARLRYQVAELLIYFGWPILVMWAINFLFPKVDLTLIFAIGALIFAWPYLKGLVGLVIAKIRGIKDPRHAIRSSSFWFDGFMFVGSPILREIRKYSALSRSLDVIYNAFGRFGVSPKHFPNPSWSNLTPFGIVNKAIKAWSNFWLDMPIAQDVRTRLEIIADEYQKTICNLAAVQPGRKIQILEIAAGQLQTAIMGIRRAIDNGADFQYHVVSLEPEEDFSVPRALELIEKYGLDKECFTLIPSGISIQKSDKFAKNILAAYGWEMKQFDIVVCIGLGDYYYTPQRIVGLLKHLDGDLNHKVITANISDNFVERGLLHKMIQWPKMKYRSTNEWKKIMFEAFGRRPMKIIQTPHKIFNIAVVE